MLKRKCFLKNPKKTEYVSVYQPVTRHPQRPGSLSANPNAIARPLGNRSDPAPQSSPAHSMSCASLLAFIACFHAACFARSYPQRMPTRKPQKVAKITHRKSPQTPSKLAVHNSLEFYWVAPLGTEAHGTRHDRPEPHPPDLAADRGRGAAQYPPHPAPADQHLPAPGVVVPHGRCSAWTPPDHRRVAAPAR